MNAETENKSEDKYQDKPPNKSISTPVLAVIIIAILLIAGLSGLVYLKHTELETLKAEHLDEYRDMRREYSNKHQSALAGMDTRLSALKRDTDILELLVSEYRGTLQSLNPEFVGSMEVTQKLIENLKKDALASVDPRKFERMDPKKAVKEMQKAMEEIEKRNRELDKILEWNAVGASLVQPDKPFRVFRVEDLQVGVYELKLESAAKEDSREKKVFDLEKEESRQLESGWYNTEYLLESFGDVRLGDLQISCDTKNGAEILDVEFKTEADAQSVTQAYKFNTQDISALPKKTRWTASIEYFKPADINLSVITDTDPEVMSCRYSVIPRRIEHDVTANTKEQAQIPVF